MFKVPGIDPCRFCMCGLRFRALRAFWGTGLLAFEFEGFKALGLKAFGLGGFRVSGFSGLAFRV